MPKTIRDQLLSSWHDSRAAADARGALSLRAEAFAGYLLEAAGGDSSTARLLVPVGSEVFWCRVLAHLDEVRVEDAEARHVREGTEGVGVMASEPIMQFFGFEHLPPRLQEVSRPFCELARALVGKGPVGLPAGPERSVALRKLLEAKDCAVRAVLSQPETILTERGS